MGLLSKVSSLDLSEELTFSNFITKYSINFFAIFDLINGEYALTNSLGFDGSSIINSSSTQDFWNGLFKENQIVTFPTDSFTNPLLQFFSFKIKDNIKNISIAKLESNKILLLCNSEITTKTISDFNKINFSKSNLDSNNLSQYITNSNYLYKLEINFQEAIETFLLSKKNNNKHISESFSQAIFNELVNKVQFLYNYPDSTIITNEFSIKTVFICDSKTSKDLLINHLVLNFKEVIGSSAEIIDFSFNGNIENLNDLKSFLQYN